MKLLKLKSVRVCRCGHSEEVHKHNRGGTDCSQCKCQIHPEMKIGLYEISSCRLYPENCVGYCWKFRDRRSKRRRFFDFLTRL